MIIGDCARSACRQPVYERQSHVRKNGRIYHLTCSFTSERPPGVVP